MSKTERIGILGGTFDPIHNTHIDMARSAIEHANLDKVLFVVAADPPHKRGEVCAGAEDRYRMVELALAGETRMEASRIELERNGPSYMADTLEQLRGLHPRAIFFLILGLDAANDLPNWHRPEAILEEARILAVPRVDSGAARATADKHTAGKLGGKLQGAPYSLLPFAMNDCSSTTIRGALCEGRSCDQWLPEPVAEYIQSRGLYDLPAAHTADR